MPMIIPSNSFQVFCGEIFCHPLGNHDGSIGATFSLPRKHHVNHAIDDAFQCHDFSSFPGLLIHHFSIFKSTANILHTQNHACFTGNRSTIREPSRASSHRLTKEVSTTRSGIKIQIANLFRERFRSGEETKSEIDPGVVIVDGLGKVNDGKASRPFREPILEQLQFVGRLESIIATNRNECIHLQ